MSDNTAIIIALISLAGVVATGLSGYFTNIRVLRLEARVDALGDYINYLLCGIDKLIDQIIKKHNDKPIWRPDRKRPKED